MEAIEKEKSESKKRIKTLESGVAEEMSNNKKELIGKIETVEADIKKKVEMEANETRFVPKPSLKIRTASAIFWIYTNSSVNTDSFYANFTNTMFQKNPPKLG